MIFTKKHLLYSPNEKGERFEIMEVWYSESEWKRDDAVSKGFLEFIVDNKDYKSTVKQREFLKEVGSKYTLSVVSTSLMKKMTDSGWKAKIELKEVGSKYTLSVVSTSLIKKMTDSEWKAEIELKDFEK